MSYYYLAVNIFLVFSISLKGIRDKKVLRFIQNLGKKVIKLSIMSNKTLYFFF